MIKVFDFSPSAPLVHANTLCFINLATSIKHKTSPKINLQSWSFQKKIGLELEFIYQKAGSACTPDTRHITKHVS